MRRPPSPAGTGTGTDDKGVTELATVIYDTPHVIKDQSAISTQDNVAYGGTIPHKKQNEAYEQVHIVSAARSLIVSAARSLIVSAARSLTCRDDLDSKWRLLLAKNELSCVSLLS